MYTTFDLGMSNTSEFMYGLRPCLSVVMVAQLSEADDVVCYDKRQ